KPTAQNCYDLFPDGTRDDEVLKKLVTITETAGPDKVTGQYDHYSRIAKLDPVAQNFIQICAAIVKAGGVYNTLKYAGSQPVSLPQLGVNCYAPHGSSIDYPSCLTMANVVMAAPAAEA